MFPELHVLLFDVDVWVTVSLFVHVTVVPTAMLSGFGRYASAPSVDAPPGIETDDVGPPGLGVGDGVGVGFIGLLLLYDEPQAALSSATGIASRRFLRFMNVSKSAAPVDATIEQVRCRENVRRISGDRAMRSSGGFTRFENVYGCRRRSRSS
jgi:hypothetical protein